jgi:hypothetical protein
MQDRHPLDSTEIDFMLGNTIGWYHFHFLLTFYFHLLFCLRDSWFFLVLGLPLGFLFSFIGAKESRVRGDGGYFDSSSQSLLSPRGVAA